MSVLADLSETRRKYGLRLGLKRKLNLWKNRYLSPSTVSTLAQELAKLGIAQGDAILVHSAFSKIGYVKGGPQTFLDALWSVIGPEGTIMMPSFPFNDPALEYVKCAPVFDVLHTPAAVGQLQEYFRVQPATLRSLHPTHPYCASGKHAEMLIERHERSLNPFSVGTPVYRFCELRGRCLIIGVPPHNPLRNCTSFRVAEEPDTYPYPVFEPETWRLPVRDAKGNEFMVETLVHSGKLAPLRHNEFLWEPLCQRGMIREGRLGLAYSILVEHRGLREVLLELLAAGITPYSGLTRASQN